MSDDFGRVVRVSNRLFYFHQQVNHRKSICAAQSGHLAALLVTKMMYDLVLLQHNQTTLKRPQNATKCHVNTNPLCMTECLLDSDCKTLRTLLMNPCNVVEQVSKMSSSVKSSYKKNLANV